MVIMAKGNGGSLLPHLATVLVAALVCLLLAPQQAHSQGLGENSATGNSFEQLLLKHGVAKDSTIIVNPKSSGHIKVKVGPALPIGATGGFDSTIFETFHSVKSGLVPLKLEK